MRASGSMVRREQPAEPVGALNGAFVFTLDPAQSGDQDDGIRLREECLGALFSDGRTGLVRVSADSPIPLAADLAVEGVRAALKTASEGPDIVKTLVPL